MSGCTRSSDTEKISGPEPPSPSSAYKDAVYAFHAFQKKSSKGIRTAKVDVYLVEWRLKVARQDYEARYGKPKR